MERTRRGDGLLLLAGASFVAGFAFQRLAPALVGVLVLGYVVYARLRFQALIDEVGVQARASGPRESVFQDASTQLRYDLRVSPPGVRTSFSLPAGEDLDVEAIDAELEETRPAGASYAVRVTVRPRRRGRFRTPGLVLRLEDPDGLFARRFEVAMPVSFTAHAPHAAIRQGAQFQELESLVAPEQADVGDWSLEVMTHRPYHPGDRDRDIDWKVSARRDELLTRIFEQEIERPLIVLLDAGRTMRYQRGGRSMLDHASEFATAIVSGAHDAGKEVGFAAFDEHRALSYLRPTVEHTVTRAVADRIAELPDPIELPPEGLVVPEADPPDAARTGTSDDGGGTAPGTGSPAGPSGAREEPSAFERTIAPFLGGRDRIPNGLARAVQAIGEGAQPRTYLVFSPLVHRPDEAEAILARLAKRQHHVIVAAPFAPFYLAPTEGGSISAEELERASRAWRAHRERTTRLEAIGCTVIDLVPRMAPQELVRTAKGARP